MANGEVVKSITNALLVTLGDPNGVGPELAVRLFHAGTENVSGQAPVLLLGPESVLEAYCRQFSIPPFWTRLKNPEDIKKQSPGIYSYGMPELDPFPLTVGLATKEGGNAAGQTLTLASSLLEKGCAGGVVTLPLHKAMLQAAGFDFPGHTEFFAAKAGIDPKDVCMHLCGERLRVSLVTTHPALRQVPDLITGDRVIHCLELTHHFLKDIGFENPVIAVCGLNPHAGEMGRIGREEIDIIEPALEKVRTSGMNVQGPLPADTVFHRAYQGDFDAVLAMYHDQGLGPLKLVHFNQSVNVTLGLPFVRTSVDHGTAYELAGKGTAETGSLEMALELARWLLSARQRGM